MRNILVALVVAAAAHASAWWFSFETILPPSIEGIIDSASVNVEMPDEADEETVKGLLGGLDHRLDGLAGVAGTIRLYSTLGGLAKVPAMAEKKGFRVILGAWLQNHPTRDAQEVDEVIELANRIRSTRSIIVGNETIMRENLTADELITSLRRVRARVKVPVSTGETWKVWMDHPRLANEVDFIAAHILPYWEGVPAEMAVEYTFQRYDELRRAFPGKRVVIAEFGWPSRGYNKLGSIPDPILQARVIREFIAEARRRDIPFNIVEAFDQPWKTAEGSVGPYWGIYDAEGRPKFSLSGLVEEPDIDRIALLALAIGAFISLFSLSTRRPTFLHAFAFALSANALAAAVAVAAFYPIENYLNFGSAMAWALGFVLMIPLTAMTMVKIHEVAEVTFGHRPKRLIPPAGLGTAERTRWPKVSIHIPAHREQPAVLKATLDAVAALDYPNLEVLVVLNNTPDEAQWRPVEEHCRALGSRFKFINFPNVAGFKAGALNAAMTYVARDAEIYALIDADYVVHKDWLRDLVPAFDDPKIALVQAPQDHRDGEESVFKTVMNSEYTGFFDIGMVQRNEDDAIIIHGTMLLVRRAAFEEVGGWGTDTITEDTELGLRLFEAGYSATYTSRRYGWGVLPDTYRAYKTQRHRWAYGAIQIIRKHWRHMLPKAPTLTPAQKFQFTSGWAHWLSDSFGVLAAIFNLIWVPMILFVGVLIPPLPFTFPILVAFVVHILHCFLLYGRRVRLPAGHIVGAALAAMSLQWTIASAVADGLIRENLPFRRTDKGGATKGKSKKSPVRTETIVGVLLALGAFALHKTNYQQVTEISIFALTLAIQSLPFLAAPAMYALERAAPRD